METCISRYIEINGEQIIVTEEVYRAYKRPLWAAHKRRERERICRNESTACRETGCVRCKDYQSGRPLSLETFMEKGSDIPGHSDPMEDFIKNLELEKLADALGELDSKNLQIVKLLFFEEMTERQVAAVVGLSQKGVNKRKNKIFKQLRVYLKDFNFAVLKQ